MTRRTLIATLLAAILAPFRRAKAAPVVTADYWRNRMQEIVDRRTAEFEATAAIHRVHYVFGTGEMPPGAEFSGVSSFAWTKRIPPTAPTTAKFGLCAKCGGLTCVCD